MDNFYRLSNDLISHKCLEEIINLPTSIKDALYTELYFNFYEPNIVAHLKSEVVWDYLLTNNKLELIKFWIDLNFGDADNVNLNNVESESDVKLLFTNLKITDKMIALIESSNGMPSISNLVLNHLSR